MVTKYLNYIAKFGDTDEISQEFNEISPKYHTAKFRNHPSKKLLLMLYSSVAYWLLLKDNGGHH
jgi:hypothetical protein